MASNQDEDIHFHSEWLWESEWHPDEELTHRQDCELKKEMDAWLNEVSWYTQFFFYTGTAISRSSPSGVFWHKLD